MPEAAYFIYFETHDPLPLLNTSAKQGYSLRSGVNTASNASQFSRVVSPTRSNMMNLPNYIKMRGYTPALKMRLATQMKRLFEFRGNSEGGH
jgi:hypothetical protein